MSFNSSSATFTFVGSNNGTIIYFLDDFPTVSTTVTTENPFTFTLSSGEFVSAMIYYAILFFVAGVGNLLSLLVSRKIISNRRKNPDLLVFYLSLTDIFCLLSAHMLSVISTLNGVWLGSHLSCTLQYYFAWSCLKTAFFILILLTIDRYIALVKPIYYKTKWGHKHTTKCVVACLIFSFGSTVITPILQWDSIFPLKGWFVCLDSWARDDPYDSAILLLYGSSFVIGLIVFNFCSIRVAWEVIKLRIRKKKTSVSHILSSESTHQNGYHISDVGRDTLIYRRVANESRVAVIVTILSAIFVVSWSPYMASLVLEQTGVYSNQRTEVLAIRIVFANTALNPLLYGLLSMTYRRGYLYFIQLALYYLSFGSLTKPEDDNIFYVRRSWLQRRQRELHSRSLKQTSVPSERQRYTGEIAAALSVVLPMPVLGGSTVIAGNNGWETPCDRSAGESIVTGKAGYCYEARNIESLHSLDGCEPHEVHIGDDLDPQTKPSISDSPHDANSSSLVQNDTNYEDTFL